MLLYDYYHLVVKLSEGKFQDILEFTQWIRQYYIDTMDGCLDTDYNPESKRKPSGKQIQTSTSSINKPISSYTPPSSQGTSSESKSSPIPVPVMPKPIQPKPIKEFTEPTPTSPASNVKISELKESIDLILTEISILRKETESIEQERDFYFAKLQKVEEICQSEPNNPLVKTILDILFALLLF